MKELRFIPERLDEIQREMGVSGYSGFLEEAGRKSLKIVEGDNLYVDVFYHSLLSSGIQKNILNTGQEQLVSSPVLYVSYNDKRKKPIKKFQYVFSSVAIIYYDECFHKDVNFMNTILSDADQYNLILLINIIEDKTAVESFCRKLPYSLKSVILPAGETSDITVSGYLERSLIQASTFNGLKKIAYCKSIKPIFVFLQEIFDSENKTIQTRKLLNSQVTQISRKEEQGMNLNDLSSNLRQLIQKSGQELDKNFKIKYEDLNKPNTGHFSKIIQQNSSELHDFSKIDLAEKSEKVGIAIEKKYIDLFLSRIKNTIEDEVSKDEPFLQFSTDDLVGKVNQQLMAKGINPVNKTEVPAPFPDKKKLLQSYSYISKNYTGELTKKGATEYFIALRDYIGIMMVATGLLAPLNLIASLSDEHSMFGFLKKLSTGIKVATALLTLSLIIYGIFDLRKRIPRKRVEEFEKELTKAREFIVQEGRRIFNESSRDWSAGISMWIRDTMQNLSNQIERNMKDMQNAKIAKLNNEKNQQVRMQQSIDLIQRNIQSAEKIKDAMATRFREIVLETEKELKF